MSRLSLAAWPTLTFVLQGLTANVELAVSPNDYWQVNAPKVGSAMAAITKGQDGLAILGLPLMNGYFTIFDGEADGGKGTINFAKSLRGAPAITKGLSLTRARLKARLPLTDLKLT